jgi:hypothetical protein
LPRADVLFSPTTRPPDHRSHEALCGQCGLWTDWVGDCGISPFSAGGPGSTGRPSLKNLAFPRGVTQATQDLGEPVWLLRGCPVWAAELIQRRRSTKSTNSLTWPALTTMFRLASE